MPVRHGRIGFFLLMLIHGAPKNGASNEWSRFQKTKQSLFVTLRPCMPVALYPGNKQSGIHGWHRWDIASAEFNQPYGAGLEHLHQRLRPVASILGFDDAHQGNEKALSFNSRAYALNQFIPFI
ncbi:hypothetical protein GALL_513180 [mine drainage metagenome]|uniref:Uncharacterized protein n=1 Tax=mine drainage metagenome TaxID=410659 RepID=A0A1J5P7C6_9ZZZZ